MSGLRSRASIRAFPFPGPWPNVGKSWCVWCGDRIYKDDGSLNLRAHWHKHCVHIHALHTRLSDQWPFVAERDGEKCRLCDSRPMRWLNQGETIHWDPDRRPPKELSDTEKRLWWAENRRVPTLIDRRSALQIDHVVPLWKIQGLEADERRGYFWPSNLQLLCPDCHKAKTKSEAAERALVRRAA